MDLFASATLPPLPNPTTPEPGDPDFFSIILWPFKFVVEAILVFWHWIFTSIGLAPDAGLTWVLSIIGLVIVVRAALIPLFVRQIKSQRKMMELAPEMRKIQERYKGKRDQLSREAMSRETMAMYKKHGTTPLSSCLPLLVQMPILLGMFYTLSEVKRHAEWGVGGTGLLNATLTREFYNAELFGVAPISRKRAWASTVVSVPVSRSRSTTCSRRPSPSPSTTWWCNRTSMLSVASISRTRYSDMPARSDPARTTIVTVRA